MTGRAVSGCCRLFGATCLVLIAAVGPVWSSTATPQANEVDLWAAEHVNTALADGLEPADFHHLYLAMEFRESFADWRTAERLLDRLTAASSVDPLMRDVVRYYRARLAYDAGRPATAREIYRTMGGLTRWWATGPFDFEELQDFELWANLPSEDAGWRFVPGTNPLGWLRLEGLGWPARRQGLTMAVTVFSENEQPIAVRLGAAQVARAWLNSHRLLTTDFPLRAAEDQVVAGGWLRQGANTLVVSVASESADWWLRVRLTAPDGSPLSGVRELDDRPRGVTPVQREQPQVHTLEDRLRRNVEGGDNDSLLALAALLVRRDSEPKASGAAREACRAARGEDLALAALLESLVTSEPRRRRDLMVESLAAGGPSVPLRPSLARWYFDRGLYEQANEVLTKHRAIPAVAATSLDLDTRRWGPIILTDLKALTTRHPRCLEALTTLASWALEFDRRVLLETTLEQAAALAPGLARVEQAQSATAGDCGDDERLRTLLEQRLEKDPNNSGGRIRLARMRAADHDFEAAERLLAAGLQRSPGDVDVLLEIAHLAHRTGREEVAAETARQVLLLRPQNRPAEQLLALLGQGREKAPWRLPEEDLWALARRADHLSGSNIVLLDHRAVRFLPGHLVEERVQQVFLVRLAEQSRGLETHYLPYVPESQNLRVLGARILRSGGAKISARRHDTPRLSEPEFNLYYDTRLRVLRFDTLTDGDLIELAYVLTETAEANETGAYEGNILRLGHAAPTLRTEIELLAPEGQMPTWELVLVDEDPEVLSGSDDTEHLRWTFADLPAVPDDVPKGPSLMYQPHLVYSNHPSWGDLAEWYSRHVSPRIRASRQVEDKARELVAEADSRSEKIARIYRFVTDQIRYVGLEFGEHRFRPFSADWVLSHRMGDCKDTAGLLVAMFTSIDIPAHMAMVRTSNLGPVSAETALLEDFNHAIAYLPEDDLWLDGTAAGHDVFPPPGADQNAWVMVVAGSESMPKTSPAPGAGTSRLLYYVTSDESDRFGLTVRVEDTGDAAAALRARFGGSRNPTLFARWLQRKFPGAELAGEPSLSLSSVGKPAVMELEATIERTALNAGGGMKVYPGDFGLDEELSPATTRSSPLLLPVRPDLEWVIEVRSDNGLPRPPDPVRLQTPYGALQVQTTVKTDGFRLEGSFRLTPGLVPAGEADQVRQFLIAVRRALDRRLEIS